MTPKALYWIVFLLVCNILCGIGAILYAALPLNTASSKPAQVSEGVKIEYASHTSDCNQEEGSPQEFADTRFWAELKMPVEVTTVTIVSLKETCFNKEKCLKQDLGEAFCVPRDFVRVVTRTPQGGNVQVMGDFVSVPNADDVTIHEAREVSVYDSRSVAVKSDSVRVNESEKVVIHKTRDVLVWEEPSTTMLRIQP